MSEATIGIIGGSGLYQIDAMTDVSETQIETPFGPPSDTIVLGTLEGKRVAFLPRHGRGHRISPSEIPFRANIYALKTLGVERIVSVNAVGSLREDMAPMDIVIPDQLIDRTRLRENTFFQGGIVAHIAFAEPFCPEMRGLVHDAASSTGVTVHRAGVYVAIEGPQFSTRAESQLYRAWGADIIGMTALPEAKLAREAEICYAVVAFVTDYDCWRRDREPVTTEMVLESLVKGAETARAIVTHAVKSIPDSRSCACASALSDAIVTPSYMIPELVKQDLMPIAGRYFADSSR